MNNITRDQPVKLIRLVSYVYLFWLCQVWLQDISVTQSVVRENT